MNNTMNSFLKDANERTEQFLANTDTTITIEFDKEVYSPWGDNMWHNAYNVTITRNGESMTVNYKDSVYDYDNKIKPTAYDILACISKYEPGALCDFCDEFGYECDEETEELYREVCREYNEVERVFGDCMDELREIN